MFKSKRRRNMGKKILALMACVVMVLAFTACGSSSKDTSDVKEVAKTKVYVSPDWVQSVIDGNQDESDNYVILECAWGKQSQDKNYKNHIKGAVHMNTDDIEESENWDIRSADELKAVMKKYGITKKTTVICYGADGKDSADDRVAFTMLYAGVENVKCLDGGLSAYKDAGYETETKSNKAKSTDKDFGTVLPAHPEYVVDTATVLNKLQNDSNFKLVSIRSYKEFTGKTSGYSYIDRAGEPKGAIWGHDTDDGSYLTKNGTTVNTGTIAKYIKPYGATLDNDLAFYCGTGWRATIPFLVCYEEGMKNIALYDDGWFVYQKTGTNPVQLGDPIKGNVEYTTVSALSTDKAVKE